MIFVTNKEGGNGELGSYEKNWLDHGHKARGGLTANNSQGLESTLATLVKEKPYEGLINSINYKIISWGVGKNELWDIFKKVVEQIKDEDEVIFDVTHSFRSLPMLVFSALLFVRSVRRIKISWTTYGAFEFLGDTRTIEERIPDPRDRNAPVLDLSMLISIVDWSEAAMLFKKHGEAGPLLDLLYEEINPLLSLSQGKDDYANKRRSLAKQIKRFVNAIRTVRGCDLVEMSSFNEALQKVKGSGEGLGAVWAFDQLFDMIENTAGQFVSGSFMNGLHSAQFCIEHGLTQQALTLLDETLVSMMCDLNGLEWRNKDHREIVSSANSIKRIPENEWHGSAGKYPELVKKVISFINEDEQYSKISDMLEIRNDINHAGIYNPTTSERLHDKSEEIYHLAVAWAEKHFCRSSGLGKDLKI